MTRQSHGHAVCRVCGARKSAYLCLTFNEHSQTKWLANFRCLDCGSVFIGNRISAEELAEAYSTIDEVAYYRETADATAPKFSNAVLELGRVISRSSRLLDVGGGNGAFIRALHQSGFTDLSVHEIPGADLPDLSNLIRHIYRDWDYSTIPTAAFDVVTMMDVLEHAPDPSATIAAARRVLRRDGILYLHTPVVTSLDRLMHVLQRLPMVGSLGRAWQRARTSIFHLQNYTPGVLWQLMERHGFDVLELRCINELSWPLARYIRVYLIEKMGLPKFFGPPAVFLSGALVRSRLNINKAVLIARVR